MPSATLTSKGQTTIPREVREHLGIRTGDRLDFVIKPDGTVMLRPATIQVSELKGILHRKKMKPVSVREMDDAIQKHVRRKYLRGRR